MTASDRATLRRIIALQRVEYAALHTLPRLSTAHATRLVSLQRIYLEDPEVSLEAALISADAEGALYLKS